MRGYSDNIEALTKENNDYRHVLYTGRFLQLVLMTIKPGEDIGEEVHTDRDQFFRIEKGQGKFVVDGHSHPVGSGSAFIAPAGSRHNVRNTGGQKLKLYTLYGPPNHLDQLIQKSKAAATLSHEKFEGGTTEQCFEPPHPSA
jgi:mannose-6-phosphate isomerase-like protein (cupin superfamily)